MNRASLSLAGGDTSHHDVYQPSDKEGAIECSMSDAPAKRSAMNLRSKYNLRSGRYKATGSWQ